MNILLIAYCDNGGQMIQLRHAINKYTKHNARCITVSNTYLDYETDILMADYNGAMHQLELRKLLRDREFFILSEFLPYHPGITAVLKAIGQHRHVTPKNTITRAGGSVSRVTGHKYLLDWIRDGWFFATTIYDWTIWSQIGRLAPMDNICPIHLMPEPNQPDDIINILYSPTSHKKGTAEFNAVMDRIANEYEYVRPFTITRSSWANCVKQKNTCHIAFDQFWIPSYANNAIEDMYLKQAVLSKLSDWVLTVRPDLPIVNTQNADELYANTKYLLDHPDEIKKLGELGHEYVMRYHTPEVVAKKWELLIEYVASK